VDPPSPLPSCPIHLPITTMQFQQPINPPTHTHPTCRSKEKAAAKLGRLEKVVVFGGGSFGTAMAASLARSYKNVQVVMLLRDPYLCKDINELHCNTRYLKVCDWVVCLLENGGHVVEGQGGGWGD
jgi:hypothetical protein